MDPLFATETMAELSARQGRVSEAVAIYRHIIGALQAAPAPGPDDAARVARWTERLAALEAGGAGVAAAVPPAVAAQEPASPKRGASAGASSPAPADDAQRASLVIQDPVRSGQVIYAQGRDLIVVASVHSGAQLLADGNIHVYGALKGRAVAGAHGARDAQVFCLALEAELVGVDSGYTLSDDIPPGLWGGPARVFLTPEGTCAVVALTGGRHGVPGAANLTRRIG
jgi:septum site-determining protein MinC